MVYLVNCINGCWFSVCVVVAGLLHFSLFDALLLAVQQVAVLLAASLHVDFRLVVGPVLHVLLKINCLGLRF